MILGIGIFMTAVSAIFPTFILSIFTKEADVIAEGAAYLRIVSIGFVFFGMTTITSGVLRSLHDVKIAVFGSVISLVVNVFFNWVFIFGNLGAPAMGVRGAAIATTIARVCEFLVVIGYTRFFEKNLKLRLKDLLKTDKSIRKTFFENCIPVMGNELLWSLGASMLSVVMGHMGQEVVAANSIYNVISQLSGVMAQGLSAAAAVLVGNTIGAGKTDELGFKVRSLQILGVAVGVVAAAIVFFSRPLMLAIYNVGDVTKDYVSQIMIAGAILELVRSLVFVNMVGILRGGGDAKFVLVNDVLFLWILAVPFGFLTGLVWNWPIAAVFLVLNCDNFIKLATSFWRIKSKKWIKDVTIY